VSLDQGSELFPGRSQRSVHVRTLRVSVLSSLPWSAERAVKCFPDRTQGDPIVLGTDQEAQPGQGSIEKLGLGCGQVFEFRAVELLPQLFASADLLSTSMATPGAILTRECVRCGAILEPTHPLGLCRLADRSETSFRG
jgi:hypothetical protein